MGEAPMPCASGLFCRWCSAARLSSFLNPELVEGPKSGGSEAEGLLLMRKIYKKWYEVRIGDQPSLADFDLPFVCVITRSRDWQGVVNCVTLGV
jgi:hypothetical protein